MVLGLTKKTTRGKDKAGNTSSRSRKTKLPPVDEESYIGTGLKKSSGHLEEYVITRPSASRSGK